MIKNQIRSFLKINYRNFVTRSEFIVKINNFTNQNLKYLDSFELKINNHKNLNIFNTHIYQGVLWFKNESDMTVYKNFRNNNIDELFDEISDFIGNEIKL